MSCCCVTYARAVYFAQNWHVQSNYAREGGVSTRYVIMRNYMKTLFQKVKYFAHLIALLLYPSIKTNLTVCFSIMAAAAKQVKLMKAAQDFVRDPDNESDTWCLVTFQEDELKLSKKGKDYAKLVELLGPDDMSFAYAKLNIGDEVTRKDKFILIVWVGSGISAVKKGRMMVPRATIDEIFSQRAKVLEASEPEDLDKAAIISDLVKCS